MPEGWAKQLLRWQARHGRRDLPWQGTRDPYRVWLSEIMLQQTQVVTVRDYYARFLQRFPDVQALAAAGLDDVLALWSGLGYYSRARNLHACAVQVVARHGGVFPHTAAQLQELPGIGPSTAAAIASICFGERVAILDGNVKRVLTRVLGFGADLAQGANERALWQLATELLPQRDLSNTMPRYTQGVMDLGATVCLPRKPACTACPAAGFCVSLQEERPEHYPVKTRKLKRTAQSLWLLWAQTRDGAVWLRQRPAPGVWAGLYCLELYDSDAELRAAVPATYRGRLEDLPVFTHVLTHKDLHLHPVRVQLPAQVKLSELGGWQSADTWPVLGLPAPVRKLLQQG
ncbi:MAG: A/G-specific adenine glycosylase [Hylemonella sp.]|uniref:A/G-specific adenine glycosylase n=1 Tax=Hylemonella sp. TaxID=2066020 RepID=UPI0022C10627|nr:A/G-specific adenine glycosylase [Hylemonella sp.]MCZ8252379.1 A/G-specific adenine glycosylase [Hylemonella sp.]